MKIKQFAYCSVQDINKTISRSFESTKGSYLSYIVQLTHFICIRIICFSKEDIHNFLEFKYFIQLYWSIISKKNIYDGIFSIFSVMMVASVI